MHEENRENDLQGMNDAEKNRLIELYGIALEEERQHDTNNTQIFIALGVVLSLFLAGIGFLFAKDFPLRYVFAAKIGILVLFALTEAFFSWTFYRIDKGRRHCLQVRTKIREKLPSERDYFVGPEQSCYEKHRLAIYIVASVIALVVLASLLFVFIK